MNELNKNLKKVLKNTETSLLHKINKILNQGPKNPKNDYKINWTILLLHHKKN